MKTLYHILFITILTICFTIPANAKVIQAASCARLDVQAAINSSQDGDTVLVPLGESTWNSEVSIRNKTIVLI